MLKGATFNAAAIVGTAVFRIVVSNDSMKNATATSHGSNALFEWAVNRLSSRGCSESGLLRGRTLSHAYQVVGPHPLLKCTLHFCGLKAT